MLVRKRQGFSYARHKDEAVRSPRAAGSSIRVGRPPPSISLSSLPVPDP